MMRDDFPFAICCPSCGKIISRSFAGTRSYTHCSQCGAGLYYKVDEQGTKVTITKEPKKPPEVPAVPA